MNRIVLPRTIVVISAAVSWTVSPVCIRAQNPSAPPPPPPRITRASDVFFIGANDAERGFLNSRNPGFIIARDIEIAGWIAKRFRNVEDWKFKLIPDPDYIAAHYGPPNTVLANATLPGHMGDTPLIPRELTTSPIPSVQEIAKIGALLFNRPIGPFDPSRRLPFADFTPTGQTRGVTVNSFFGPIFPHMEVELNKWYVEKATDGPFQFSGRGPAPAKWVKDGMNPNVFWAFDPENPDGTPLQEGDYVIVHGTLWQDGGHVDGWPCSNLGGLACEHDFHTEQTGCWNRGEIPPDPPAWPKSRWMEPNGGWPEIHPVDFIVHAAPPRAPRAARMVSLCAPVMATDVSRTVDVALSPLMFDDPEHPDIKNKSWPAFAKPQGSVLHVEELIDGRYTDMRTVDEHSYRVVGDSVIVHVKVHSSGTLSLHAKEGRFKAAYILSWGPPAPPPPPVRRLIASIAPSSINTIGITSVKVHAEDATTHAAVRATVTVNGLAKGSTDTPLQVAACTMPAAAKGQVREVHPASIKVSAAGYAETAVSFDCTAP